MQLILSNTAVPSVSIDELRRGARCRDLAGIEFSVGVESAVVGVPSASGQPIEDGEPPVQWLLLDEEVTLTERLYWGRQAHLLGAGLILRSELRESPRGVPLALRHPTEVVDAQRPGPDCMRPRRAGR